ncbi:Paired box protein Pax-6 [Toxocara canis]|uniref:Paired box protein Pax-6 n=1 Tax=Toxocara canis TaxID=6265 RepID=A0A0B2VC61_TOXCA|nr:Paired box protein Pax-6 [Toxocara canis]
MAVALNTTVSKRFPISSPIKYDVPVEYSPLLLLNSLDGYVTGPAVPAYVATPKQTSFLPYTPLPVFHASQLAQNFSYQKCAYPMDNLASSPQIDATSQTSSSKNKLGRAYNPGRPLAMADRQKILQLYEKGHKISHIARIIGVTHSCVSKIMTRYRRTGSMYPRSTCSARVRSVEINSETSDSEKTIPESDVEKTTRSENNDTSPTVLIHRPFAIKSYSIQRQVLGSGLYQ